jgi:hypothetical protein
MWSREVEVGTYVSWDEIYERLELVNTRKNDTRRNSVQTDDEII